MRTLLFQCILFCAQDGGFPRAQFPRWAAHVHHTTRRPALHHQGGAGRGAAHVAGLFNQFLPTVATFAVRETDVSRHNGAPRVPPLNYWKQMLERWV